MIRPQRPEIRFRNMEILNEALEATGTPLLILECAIDRVPYGQVVVIREADGFLQVMRAGPSGEATEVFADPYVADETRHFVEFLGRLA
jgi:hypothetical protein